MSTLFALDNRGNVNNISPIKSPTSEVPHEKTASACVALVLVFLSGQVLGWETDLHYGLTKCPCSGKIMPFGTVLCIQTCTSVLVPPIYPGMALFRKK